MLLNMEATYPWLKMLLGERRISVQGQHRYPLKTSVNQRGEQTISKNAKTAGLFLSQYLLNMAYQPIISRMCSYLSDLILFVQLV